YVLSERQQLALVEATTDKYREQGRIKLEGHGRPSWAHPVVVGGVLYVRDQHTLTAYQVR
ncbi:MAG TPA: polyvinylalcohol dehydrogenase, partial [Planctomycetaceae bacterium]|nr:polyvinylalcohol dehydrogenase [Planctomycetaceae bacterium]